VDKDNRQIGFISQRLLAGVFAGSIGCITGVACAAQVPAGVELAAHQELARHLKDEPASLDPAKAIGLPEAQVLRDLFEGLVNQNEQGEPCPGVAESWSTPNNQTFIFNLRKNARWSNGDSVTANDFVYSWRRLLDGKSGSQGGWFVALAGIENAQEIIEGRMPVESLGVTAVNDYQLKIQLQHPVPYFVSLLAHFYFFPVHQTTLTQYGDAWTQPGKLVSNGAFTLQQRVVNEKLVLTPNQYYWDHQHTVLTKVTFLPINKESAATKRYLANDLDITESFPKDQYQQLLASHANEVFTPAQLGTYYYAFNTQRAPTNDARVRQALSYSIDRRIIAQKVLGSGEKPAWRLTPDVTRGFSPTESILQQYTQEELNVQAKSLLALAGFGPANPLHLTLLYNTAENNQKIAVAVASMWKKNLGVEVNLVNQEWKTYLDNRNSGNFDVIRASWVGDYNEPSSFLSILTSQHTGNISRFHQESYDHLLAQASIEQNAQARNEDYDKAEKVIAEQAPIAPIYQYTNARLIKPWVKGYPINNPEDVAYSQQIYIVSHSN